MIKNTCECLELHTGFFIVLEFLLVLLRWGFGCLLQFVCSWNLLKLQLICHSSLLSLLLLKLKLLVDWQLLLNKCSCSIANDISIGSFTRRFWSIKIDFDESFIWFLPSYLVGLLVAVVEACGKGVRSVCVRVCLMRHSVLAFFARINVSIELGYFLLKYLTIPSFS